MKEYTKGGYESASKTFNQADLEVDLSNKAVMITGANSGIGKIAALEGKLIYSIYLVDYWRLNYLNLVAKRNATVYMICRSKERGDAAQKEIIDQSNNTVNLFIT